MKNDKTALITGASSGIGKEFAHIHAKQGGDLVIVARSENKLNELKEELEKIYKISVTVIAKDLSESQIASLLSKFDGHPFSLHFAIMK